MQLRALRCCSLARRAAASHGKATATAAVASCLGRRALSRVRSPLRRSVASVPKYRLAEEGLPAAAAAQIIRDERQLDANPRLNLATFLTTWMEPEARELMADALAVNAVELEEYGSVTEMTSRCVAILSRLFNLPDDVAPAGAATVGSTEALMLALLALKARWQRRRREAGLPVDAPNLVLGHEAQVALEKFCRYFEVQPRFVELSEQCLVATPEGAVALVDERTIGVVAVLGSTYTGEFEDVAALCEQLGALNAEHPSWDVRVHVDAASGGFVAPFTQPELRWDFRQPLVASINVSGHKFGLVYPGVGWTLFRDKALVESDLVLHTHYLGGDQPNFNLNFSKPAAPIVGQYYMLLRLGRSGYASVMARLMETKRQLEDAILRTGHFRLLSPRGAGVPLVAASLRRRSAEDPDAPERLYDEFEVSDRLRMHGWTVPAYRMAPRAQRIMLLRMVVREDLSPDTAHTLGRHLAEAVEYLDARTARMQQEDATCVPLRSGMRKAVAHAAASPRVRRRFPERFTAKHAPHRMQRDKMRAGC